VEKRLLQKRVERRTGTAGNKSGEKEVKDEDLYKGEGKVRIKTFRTWGRSSHAIKADPDIKTIKDGQAPGLLRLKIILP